MRALLPNKESTDNNTLGALLYADPSRQPTPEAEWEALVRAVAQGDQTALRALYDRSHRLVFTLGLRITGDRQTAEELTVDVFHGLWQRAATYDAAAGTVIAWIMNRTRSRAIDRLRREQRRKRKRPHGVDGGDNGFDPTAAISAADDAGLRLDRQHDTDVLRLALAGLTDGERAAIETAYFSELSYSQVAARLRQPVGTIKTRIRTGLAKLRKTLNGAARP